MDFIHKIRASFIKKRMKYDLLLQRKFIVKKILKDSSIKLILEELAKKEGDSYKNLEKEAYKYLKEIATDYNYTYLKIFSKILFWVWNNIYSGIKVDNIGLTNIKKLCQNIPVILLPSHRSHLDYLILSSVLYNFNLPPPLVAAGNNLSFWPLGYIFRKCGAFFIRRTFKSNRLYKEVLYSYFKELLIKRNHPLEFFIEGGRTRTGKMLQPKVGLISMVVKAYLENNVDDIAFIPISINYEKLFEEKEYSDELQGNMKKMSKLMGIVRLNHIFKKKYGRVYIQMDEPIYVKEYFPEVQKDYFLSNEKEKKRVIYKLASQIAYSINTITMITPLSILACCLLSNGLYAVTYEEIKNRFSLFYNFLKEKKARMSSFIFNELTKVIDESLTFLISNKLITQLSDEDEKVFYINLGKHIQLDIYKNSILQFFLFTSLLAAAILSFQYEKIYIADCTERFLFLKDLLKFEFIYRPDSSEEVYFNGLLEYFTQNGYFKEKTNNYCIINEDYKAELLEFYKLILNFLESYYVVSLYLKKLKDKFIEKDELLEKIMFLGEKMLLKGELKRPEAQSKINYSNALNFFLEKGIISERTSYYKKGIFKKKVIVTEYKLSEDRNLDISYFISKIETFLLTKVV